MTNIAGKARLGENPELKIIGTGEDKKYVCEMSVKFVNAKKDKVTDEWIDNGFWADLTVWGSCAESAQRLFEVGDTIVVLDGNLFESSWPDKVDPNKIHTRFKVNATLVAPFIPDIESLCYKVRLKKKENIADEQRTGTDG